MLPLELSGSRDARRASSEMLGTVGLSSRLQHYPKTLSGGEQQRVALARAFVMRPALLLADEPTGSLDAATGNGVMDLMFELNRQYASTLVLVTHDGAIAGRCERRLTLADHEQMTAGVECRKDADVIDETPAAYKPIDAVMAAQSDLVEIVHTLRQVVCVKG